MGLAFRLQAAAGAMNKGVMWHSGTATLSKAYIKEQASTRAQMHEIIVRATISTRYVSRWKARLAESQTTNGA